LKILHTSDLHLGKRLHGVERLDAQRAMMEQIVDITKEQGVRLVVIAGDVFDTPTPSAEAEKLFYDAVVALGELATVLVVSGNHDDATRLTAARLLAARHNVVMCGSFDEPPQPSKTTVATGKNWVRLSIDGERVNAVLFPYPTDVAMGGEIKEDETYAERVKARLFAAAEACYGEGFNLLVTHLFCLGAVKSGSERDIELGTARIIPLDCLPKSDYVALGHIHKEMELGEGIYYSGAPLAYTFDEIADKFVLLVDTQNGSVERKKLTPTDRLLRVCATTVDEAVTALTENADALVDLRLSMDRSLTVEENRALKACKNLIHIQLDLTTAQEEARIVRAEQTPEEMFRAYCESKKVELTSELLQAFLEALGEV